MTDTESVKPCRYMPHGAVLLFPPQTPLGRRLYEGKLYCNGWKKLSTIRSSYPTHQIVRLCG